MIQGDDSYINEGNTRYIFFKGGLEFDSFCKRIKHTQSVKKTNLGYKINGSYIIPTANGNILIENFTEDLGKILKKNLNAN